VDPLRTIDIEEMRRTPPPEKARQAFELMAAGIRWKRASLRARHTDLAAEEIERMLDAWLAEQDD
jgi:hypothetical protein